MHIKKIKGNCFYFHDYKTVKLGLICVGQHVRVRSSYWAERVVYIERLEFDQSDALIVRSKNAQHVCLETFFSANI